MRDITNAIATLLKDNGYDLSVDLGYKSQDQECDDTIIVHRHNPIQANIYIHVRNHILDIYTYTNSNLDSTIISVPAKIDLSEPHSFDQLLVTVNLIFSGQWYA